MGLWMLKGLEEGLLPEPEQAEFRILKAEFEAWQPEPFADPLANVETPQHYERWQQMRDERDEARQIARELLEDADADDWDKHRMQKRYPWLKETHG